MSLENPYLTKSYIKDKIVELSPGIDLEKSFFINFKKAQKARVKADRIFITLSVEGEPAYEPGGVAKNQMLIQLAIMDNVAKKDDFDAEEAAKAATYEIAWKLLQKFFQDYSSRSIMSFKFSGSRILPLESDELQGYYGSLLTFRITGNAPLGATIYNP